MEPACLKEYLQRWRRGECIITNASNNNNNNNNSVRRLPRSFRPHRIVPHVYLGSLKDVQDTAALYQRLLPEGLTLIVSTCAQGDMPRLEMRQLLPVQTSEGPVGGVRIHFNKGGGCRFRVRRLAVCSWEKLQECVLHPSCGPPPGVGINDDTVMMRTARWLQDSMNSWSFDADGGCTMNIQNHKGKENNNKKENGQEDGLIYLKLCLPWRDECTFPVRDQFHVSTALMRAVVRGLQRTVVCHCVAGVSRSVTLVAAFLLRCCRDENVSAAALVGNSSSVNSHDEVVRIVLDFVREVRLCACPNDGFTQQLSAYARDLFSSHPGSRET